MNHNRVKQSSSGLSEKIFYLREKSLKRKKINNNLIDIPVAFWIKEDRLLDEVGKEFNIILRTPGCYWALSKTGGCSMCGYVEDAYMGTITPENLINQFDYAVDKKIEEIKNDRTGYILKIFNSGSFFDEREIPKTVAEEIFKKIKKLPNVKEVVIESRPEFIKKKKIKAMKEILDDKYVEIGIGVETVNDYIRNTYINKGMKYEVFLRAVEDLKNLNVGIKAYLLFKPPFLTEQAAIDDCRTSIRKLIDLKINTISINPVNIQKGSFVEYLWNRKKYRPPWFYSLFECLKQSVTQKDLKTTRIISDPSGAGSQRGIHNCQKFECNNVMKDALREFVLSQDLMKLNIQEKCECKKRYELKKDFI